MFNDFIRFIGDETLPIANSVKDFLEKYSGVTFLNGLYRIHRIQDISKWNEIVAEAFPPAKDVVLVFGYDWVGRMFAIFSATNTVLILEPGTGEAYDTGMNFETFHNKEIPQNHTSCLMSEYFQEWKEHSNATLAHNECVGYKVPLFLNGKDEVENLEISDIEVYWGIMAPLINT